MRLGGGIYLCAAVFRVPPLAKFRCLMVQFVKALSTVLSNFVRLSNYVIYCCFLRSPQQLVVPMGRTENVRLDGP